MCVLPHRCSPVIPDYDLPMLGGGFAPPGDGWCTSGVGNKGNPPDGNGLNAGLMVTNGDLLVISWDLFWSLSVFLYALSVDDLGT